MDHVGIILEVLSRGEWQGSCARIMVSNAGVLDQGSGSGVGISLLRSSGQGGGSDEVQVTV